MIKVDPLSKRYYMTQKNFWADPHNNKMAELGKMLYKQRGMLASIQEYDSAYFQKTDGTLALRKKRGFLSAAWHYFEDRFAIDMNNEYTDIKKEISNVSSHVKF